jgi:hypothetical protein
MTIPPFARHLLLLSVLAGCSQLEQVRECDRLIGRVNSRLNRISELAAPYSDRNTAGDAATDREATASTAAFEALALEYETLVAELMQDELDNAQLKAALKNYSMMLDSVVKELRRLAGESKQPLKPNKADKRTRYRTLERLVAREGPLITQINRICQAP